MSFVNDVMDRLSNLFFDATSTITTPLPADLNGARYTIDASLTSDEIVVQARTSIAWRYALRELNSFVISDVDYQRHNTDGSLDLYNEQTGQGAMTCLSRVSANDLHWTIAAWCVAKTRLELPTRGTTWHL